MRHGKQTCLGSLDLDVCTHSQRHTVLYKLSKLSAQPYNCNELGALEAQEQRFCCNYQSNCLNLLMLNTKHMEDSHKHCWVVPDVTSRGSQQPQLFVHRNVKKLQHSKVQPNTN